MANIKKETDAPKKNNFFKIGCISILGIIAIVVLIIVCDEFDIFKKTYTKESAKIEKLISERNFDKAREIANSIPANAFEYINGGRMYYRTNLMTKINTAQLSILTSDGQWYDAQDLALEIGAQDEFQQLVSANLNRILRTQNYDMIFEILSTWQISHHYYSEVSDYSLTDKGDIHESQGNVPYNEDVQSYNQTIDAVLQALIINQRTDLIKKCLPLYKEEAVFVKMKANEYNTAIFKLENKARKSAMEKLKAEGITIK